MLRIACLGIAVLIAIVSTESADAAEPAALGPQVPVSVTWGPGSRLHVALRDARRIAVVEPGSWKVVATWNLGIKPAHLAVADDRSTLLVGGVNGEFQTVDSTGRIRNNVVAGRGPTRVLALDKRQAAVACLWDDCIRIVNWSDGAVVAQHALPFSPKAMVRRPDGRVIVADGFGGGIADLDPRVPGTLRSRLLDGVNLNGIAISGDGKELLVAHVAQPGPVPITESNIDGGRVLSSRLSAIRLTDFDAPGPPGSLLPSRQLSLDGPRHGAADPSDLALTPDGTKLLISTAGSHQLLLSDRTLGAPPHDATDLLSLGHNQRLEVVAVGRTPLALALDPTGSIAVTADAMSDTLSVVKVADLTLVATVRLSSGRTARTAAQRGEAHFLDGSQAMDRWMSCASCHATGHSNGLNFDTLGDGDFGAPKNTPSLLGVNLTTPFTWTGRFPNLADQVRQSVLSSMHGPSPAPGVVEDLTAYLESLEPPPGRRNHQDPAVLRGLAVFRAQRCDGCHRAPLFTIDGVRDVGLDDGPGGHRRFNPPSLRGVSRSAPYLHDGRAKTLDQVLQVHRPGQAEPLSTSDRDDLVSFLESL